MNIYDYEECEVNDLAKLEYEFRCQDDLLSMNGFGILERVLSGI